MMMIDDDNDDDDDGDNNDGDSNEVLLHYLVHGLQAWALGDEVLSVGAVQPKLDGSELLLVVLGHGQDGIDCDGVFDFLAEILHQGEANLVGKNISSIH